MFRRHHFWARSRTVVVACIVLGIVAAIFGSIQPLFAQSRQLSLADILIALRSKKAEIDEKNRILAEAVKDRGITFSLTPEIEKELDSTGARLELIAAIRSKVTSVEIKRTESPKVEPPVAKPVPPPQDFAYFRNRAADHLRSGDLDLAAADLGKALELKPADPETLLERGKLAAKQGRSDSAIADLDKVIEIDPKNAEAYFNRGQLLEKAGKIDRAIADYDKAGEIDAANDAAKSSAARLKQAVADAAKKANPVVPTVEKQAVPTVVSVGALNSYATNLAAPRYSELDRRMNLFGRVTVQVSLDEEGKVTSARASDGARSLRISAEDAVYRSKFRPIKSGNTAVKATGYIVFNFVNQ